MFWAKEGLKAQQHANFLGDHESVFSYDSNVPGIVHFRLNYAGNRVFLGEGIATSKPPSTYEFERSLLHVILCQITGKTA